MHRGQEPGDLAEGAKLEGGVVQRELALQQDGAQLEDDRQPEGERHGHAAHFCRDIGIGPDHDLGLAAGDPGDLDRFLPAFRGANTGHNSRLGVDHHPDQVAVEAANQGVPAALEQLSV